MLVLVGVLDLGANDRGWCNFDARAHAAFQEPPALGERSRAMLVGSAKPMACATTRSKVGGVLGLFGEVVLWLTWNVPDNTHEPRADRSQTQHLQKLN